LEIKQEQLNTEVRHVISMNAKNLVLKLDEKKENILSREVNKIRRWTASETQ
jgi:hypothetical protein